MHKKNKEQKEHNDVDDENKTDDDIDKVIALAVDEEQLDIRCPDQNSSAPCPAMLFLVKVLVRYKQWLDAIRSGTLLDTVEVDIARNVSKAQFRSALATPPRPSSTTSRNCRLSST